jgi:hypothetical protein
VRIALWAAYFVVARTKRASARSSLSTAARHPVFNCSLRSVRIALWAAYFVVALGQTRVRSLLLSTAARDPVFTC